MRRTTIVVALALVAACGGTDSTPIEGQATPTTARPAGGTLVPSSSIAPTTTAEPTSPTSPPATAPTTVAVATPDGGVDEATKAAVLAGYEHYLAGLKACGESPQTCDPASFTAKDSPAGVGLLGFAQLLESQEQRAVEGASTYTVLSLRPDAQDSWILDVCYHDAGITFDTHATPQVDDDTVVNDDLVSIRTSWRVVAEGLKYRLHDGVKLSSTVGASCG